MIRLRGPVILMDHAAEYLAALHQGVEWHDDRFVMIGWPLLPGPVRPVPVIAPCGARLLDLAWTDFPAGIIAE